MEAAAELVVDAAARHRVERCAASSPLGSPRSASRNSSTGAGGNFGAPPKPPSRASNVVAQRAPRVGRAAPRSSGSARVRAEPPARRARASSAPACSTSARRSLHASATRGAPGETPAGRAAARAGSTCRRRTARRRREEHGQRPAAAARHRDARVHVDVVEVGPLLAIDLDRRRSARSSARRSPRPRTTRAPSRGTSGTPSSRSRGRSACPRARARSNASSPHGYQSTGLCACWRRYGETSPGRGGSRR